MPNPYVLSNGDTTTVFCMQCDRRYELLVTEEQLQRWQAGELIQNAMTDLPPRDRELFISGTCDRCWRKMFGSPATTH
jgi:hypothetical protein